MCNHAGARFVSKIYPNITIPFVLMELMVKPGMSPKKLYKGFIKRLFCPIKYKSSVVGKL